MTFITAFGCYFGFSFFRIFEEVERVDGVVLESSSVSEANEGKDVIFFIFINEYRDYQ